MADNQQQPLSTNYLEQTPDFESVYANNVQFLSSAMDLKMTFGQSDQRPNGSWFVEQHTAVTIPWIQAKIMLFFLHANIFFHENANGTIRVPPQLMPSGDIPKAWLDDPKMKPTIDF